MSETIVPFGETLRNYSTSLDAHFDSDIEDARRQKAVEYVGSIFKAMKAAQEEPWIERATQRFAEWDEKVVGPVCNVLGEAEDIAITADDINFNFYSQIPLNEASSTVNIKLRLMLASESLYLANADLSRAQNILPAKENDTLLWKPNDGQRELAERVGSVVLTGRNKLGIKRQAVHIPEVRQAALSRLQQTAKSTEFRGVHYDIMSLHGRQNGTNILAKGGVINPIQHEPYKFLYDSVSPFHYDIPGLVAGKFDVEELPSVADGGNDKRVRSYLRSILQIRKKEVESQYEFTDKVLQLIVESDFMSNLATSRQGKVTEL